MNLSDDEGAHRDSEDIAEDSGIRDMLSERDTEQLPPALAWTENDRYRIAAKIICRETDPRPGCRKGSGDFLMRYRDNEGDRWLTAWRVGRNYPNLRDAFFDRFNSVRKSRVRL